MAGTTITTATRPVPMIPAAAAGATIIMMLTAMITMLLMIMMGREQHRRGVYERANASSGPKSGECLKPLQGSSCNRNASGSASLTNTLKASFCLSAGSRSEMC